MEDTRTESRLRITIIFTDKPSENWAALTSHQSKKALIGLPFLTLARVCVEKFTTTVFLYGKTSDFGILNRFQISS